MANDLTGDFDVVAEFSLPAANRVLAAMHRGQRIPHSLSLSVVDSHKVHGLPGKTMVALSVVDGLGNALVNPVLLAQPRSSLRLISPSNPLFSALDALANAPRRVHSEAPGFGDYTGLEGRAQLQLGAPTMTIPDQLGTHMIVHMQMMARWLADPNTPLMPEFLRGEIQIKVGVDQVASQVGNVVDINLKPKNVEVTFHPHWYSKIGLSIIAGGPGGTLDINRINQVISNAITTSFQPSNAVLPPSVQHMQFKGLAGDSPAIGVLLNIIGDAGDPGSLDNVFLGNGDDFAFASSSDFILGKFDAFVNQLKALQIPPIPFSVPGDPWGTHTYEVSINSVTLELQNGQIYLTVKGHAHTSSAYPDFDFTFHQAFTLVLVDAYGNPSGPLRTAQLAPLGDVVLDPISGIVGAIINAFKDRVLNTLRQSRDKAIAGVQGTVRDMLSADRNLGGFLKSLMNPVPNPGAQPQEEIDPDLEYTSVEINPSGVVLHGSLAVPEWPAVHAEFEITPNDYNALNSWIPGGTIQQYTWGPGGQPPLHTEPNMFVFLDPRTRTLLGMNICVTVQGTRITASGPVTEQPVSAKSCRWISLPLDTTEEHLAAIAGDRGARLHLPDLALTQFTTSGALEVVGHTSPWAPPGSGGSANLIVHFPDEKSLAHLDHLATAARQSERPDASVAILAVLAPDQLAKVKPTGGLLFADYQDGAWEHLLGAQRRPATVVVGASGRVVWRHEGELAIAALADALKTHLVAGGSFMPRLLQLSVRIGQPPPNFVFDYAPGREITLRKLVGRPVVLVFWKSSSKPSLEMLRQLQTMGEAGGRGPVVLAINDGEAPELVKKVAADLGLSAIVVPDPEREIALAYGVNIWPTTAFVDALGLVRDIRYGLFSVEQVKHSSQPNTTAAQ